VSAAATGVAPIRTDAVKARKRIMSTSWPMTDLPGAGRDRPG
jgi:hypothetical protein